VRSVEPSEDENSTHHDQGCRSSKRDRTRHPHTHCTVGDDDDDNERPTCGRKTMAALHPSNPTTSIRNLPRRFLSSSISHNRRRTDSMAAHGQVSMEMSYHRVQSLANRFNHMVGIFSQLEGGFLPLGQVVSRESHLCWRVRVLLPLSTVVFSLCSSELGINFSHIRSKSLAVLNPFERIDAQIMDDADLAGPLIFFLCFATFLLFVRVFDPLSCVSSNVCRLVWKTPVQLHLWRCSLGFRVDLRPPQSYGRAGDRRISRDVSPWILPSTYRWCRRTFCCRDSRVRGPHFRIIPC